MDRVDPIESLRRTQTICLVLLTVIAVGFSLYFLQSVLLPFVISLFIVSGCRPILDFLERRLRLNWFFAFMVTFAFGVALFAAFSFFTWLSINDLSRQVPAYKQRIESIVDWVSARIPGRPKPPVVPPAQDLSPDLDGAAETGSAASDGVQEARTNSEESLEGDQGAGPTEGDQGTLPTSGDPPGAATPDGLEGATDEASQLVTQSSAALQDLLDSVGAATQGLLLSLASSLTSLLSYGVLILIFVFFLLLGKADSTSQRPQILVDMDNQIRKYIVMKTVISALTGFATGMVLWLFSVPLAIVFGMMAFLLNFIPNIGPLIANMLPIPFLILNEAMSPGAAIICFILISAIQFISGNVIETRVMGKSFDVSPVVLLLSLMFFGLVWGIVGMFLATPIVSVIKIALQQHQATQPMAELLAGRWTVGGSESAHQVT